MQNDVFHHSFSMALMHASKYMNGLAAQLLSSLYTHIPVHLYAHKHVRAGIVSMRAPMKLVKCMQLPFLLEVEMKWVYFAVQKWL
jgi:hypothetical protein